MLHSGPISVKAVPCSQYELGLSQQPMIAYATVVTRSVHVVAHFSAGPDIVAQLRTHAATQLDVC
jgi:hypothetical protein